MSFFGLLSPLGEGGVVLQNPFQEKCFVPILDEKGTAFLKKLKMRKVYNNKVKNDKQQTNSYFLSEKLT